MDLTIIIGKFVTEPILEPRSPCRPFAFLGWSHLGKSHILKQYHLKYVSTLLTTLLCKTQKVFEPNSHGLSPVCLEPFFPIVYKPSKFFHSHLEEVFYIFPTVYNYYVIMGPEVSGEVNCQVGQLLNNAQCGIFEGLQEIVFNCSTLSSTLRLIMPLEPGGISEIQSY